MMKGKMLRIGILAIIAVFLQTFPVSAAETIKIALIEGMSGPFANVGSDIYKLFSYAVNKVNARGGVLGGKKLELVVFESKSNPQEALIQLKNATDQGIRIITQGSGSSVAAALIDAANKIYERTPEKAVLLLNFGALTTSFTNENASFWHFRFEAHNDMKIAVIANFIAKQKTAKKVYIIGQDYAHGQNFRVSMRKFLTEKCPDVKIVGDELHPMGKVKDFSPYIAKIRASGADTVITGNWGNDLDLLGRAASDSGLKVDWITYFATGTFMRNIGDDGIGRVYMVSEYDVNSGGPLEKDYINFAKEYKVLAHMARIWNEVEMLAKAIDQAKSADPIKVARALEGMKYKAGFGEVWMRADDHQLMTPLTMHVMEKAGPGQKVKHEDMIGTGYGFRPVVTFKMQDTVLPHTAKIVRP